MISYIENPFQEGILIAKDRDLLWNRTRSKERIVTAKNPHPKKEAMQTKNQPEYAQRVAAKDVFSDMNSVHLAKPFRRHDLYIGPEQR